MKKVQLSDLFAFIESGVFAAEIGLVGGYKHLIRVLENDRPISSLASLIEDRDSAERCLNRILEISAYPIDARFKNPLDGALAAYLFALAAIHPDLGRIAAPAVLRCPNCWWAKRLASEMIYRAAESSPDSKVVQRTSNFASAFIGPQPNIIFTKTADPALLRTSDRLISARIASVGPVPVCIGRESKAGQVGLVVSNNLFPRFWSSVTPTGMQTQTAGLTK
jgi:hypothetical protein